MSEVLIEERVQTILSADAGVLALVPVERIKVPGEWQKLALPYIIHEAGVPIPEYMHSGRQALTPWIYQVSCFAESYTAARRIAVAVRDALEGTKQNITCFWRDQRRIQKEAMTTPPIHEIAMDFDVHEALSLDG